MFPTKILTFPTVHHVITRRQFLATTGTAIGATGLLGLYAWKIEPHWIQVVERQLPIINLPESLVGKTLVQISDLHIGPDVDSDYLIDAMRRISAMQPDMVAITGDFVSYKNATVFDEVARVLEHLQGAPLGCVAICGNHDYGWNWSQVSVADRLEHRLTGIGNPNAPESLRQFRRLEHHRAGRLLGAHVWAKRSALANQSRASKSGFVPQSRRRRSSDLERLPRLGACRSHAWRANQAAVFAAADFAGAKQTLHRRRVRSVGRPLAVHQPRTGAHAAGAIQRAAGNHGVPADCGGVIRK